MAFLIRLYPYSNVALFIMYPYIPILPQVSTVMAQQKHNFKWDY